MSITRIKNNQITDLTVNAAAKLQDYSITSGKIANNLTYNSNLTIAGNLDVTGQTTTIDTVDLVVEDPLILLAKNQTGSPTLDIGFIGKRGTENNIAFVWDESADEFVTAFTTSEVTNTTITIDSYASFRTANLTAGNANVSGNLSVGNISLSGNIDVLTVTGNVSASNFFTTGTVSATGNVDAGNVNAGALSISGNILGGNISVSGSVTAASFVGNISGNIDAAGANTQIQFNTDDVLDASANLTFDKATNSFTVSNGNITGGNLLTGGVISATSTITGGNLVTGGTASVTGNITGGNVNASIVSATGNVQGGNLTTAGLITATGTITGGNLLTGGEISATSTITGGNLATGGTASAAGTITGGNLATGGTASAAGTITGGNVLTGGVVSATGNITTAARVITPEVTTASGDLVLNSAGGALQWDGSGNIVMNSQWINNLSDPTQAKDAATKEYVDNAVSTGITIHPPVRVEAPTALNATYAQGGTTATVNQTIAGNTVVFSSAINPQPNDQLWFTNSFNGIVGNTPYFVVSAPNTSAAVLSLAYSGAPVTNISNGTSLTQAVRINSGQGATLTNAGANAALVIDGVTVSNTDRVLIYTQANAAHNGVYVVTNAGNVSAAWVLTRSSDMNTYIPNDINGVDAGDYFFVQEGDTGSGESYVMTDPVGPIIIGYDSLTFTQFSSSQTYTANTAAGLFLDGTIFNAKVDNNTTAFDGGGNIVVKAGANLTTPNIGAATGTSLSVTGNVTGGNIDTGGVITATSTITGGNLTTGGVISATGNITGGNILTGGVISTTGNILGGNISVSGSVTAASFVGNISGNIDAAGANTQIQFNTDDVLDASANFAFDKSTNALTVSNGNITGGNLLTGGVISATGTITGGNLVTGGTASVTGNITGGNVLTGGVISATSTITSGAGVTATGTITGGNLATGGTASATGNITGGNILTSGVVSATSTITGGNLVTGGTASATGNITGANLILTSGAIDGPAAGRITINASDADVDFAIDGDTLANVFYVDAGLGTVAFGNGTAITNAIVSFNTTDSVRMPVGNLSQRPSPASMGMLRFSTTSDALEVYTASGWETVAAPEFTVVVADSFAGNGVQTQFTLSDDSTTAGTIVSINGVVQIPTTAYAVSGNVLTFTEAPAVSDVIDARILTTTTSVNSIENISANAVVRVTDSSNTVEVTGNLYFNGEYTEKVFTITDGASVDLDPSNGTIQLWTLGASRSPTATSFDSGQSMTLMIDDGTAYSITWPSVTWVGNSVPVLAASGYTVIELWKVSTTLYGALIGSVS